MLDFYPLSCDALASPVALAPGELGALTQPPLADRWGSSLRDFSEFFVLLVNLLPQSASL